MKWFKLDTSKEANYRGLALILITGLIYSLGQQFNKSTLDGFIILVIAIGAGGSYHWLKRKLKIENNSWRTLATLAILFVVSAFLIGAFTAIDKTDKDAIISGSTRTYFVSEVISECSSSISNSKNAGLSPEQINKYCTCGANGIADITTLREAESVKSGAGMSAVFKAKAEQIYTNCKQTI